MNENSKTTVALLAVGLVVAALSSVIPSQVGAQETKLMYACYMQGSGVVYRINPPDDPGQDPKLKDDCTGKNHVKFYWVEFVGADGKVGIGVPEPTAELDVAGDIHASGQLRLGEHTITIDPVANTITTGTDEDLAILPGGTGKVGIGTDAPGEMMSVAGTIESTDGGFKFPDGTVQATAASGSGTSDHGSLTGLGDDDHLQYLLAGGERSTENGFAVTGTLGAGSIPAQGEGVRLIWYPGKAAFRAGSFTAATIDEHIGMYSTATGTGWAPGEQATALGGAQALGKASTALGWGYASGDFSTSTGGVASGWGSTSMGVSYASGEISTAIGYHTKAEADFSTSMGNATKASGWGSTSMGDNTTAQAYLSVVLGRYNVIEGNIHSWVDDDPVLVVGNGTSESNPADAFRLLKNGNLSIAGAFTANGIIESTSGGIRFPDGSLQTTASGGGGPTPTLVVTERFGSVTVPAGGLKLVIAQCLSGEVLSGGGFKANGAGKAGARIIDNGTTGGNGWIVQALNQATEPYELVAVAHCLKLQ